ncbi:MAG: aldo/keto reductase [Deltaproteobacteria bacterium]|nr:aldo/keto reductase [Deltaproteobacteria bacterium]
MVSELVTQRSYATEAGTHRFARRHGAGKAADAYSQLARLELSSIGIGTYLGQPCEETDDAYTAAIVDAVRRGLNVIDTAANFRCQRSERAVGRALQQLIQAGEIYRSEVLVASAGGMVAFDTQPPTDKAHFLRSATVGRGLCDEGELVAGCHCMAPAFLEQSLAASLDNLGLSTLDVYYVHNPETQLHLIDRPQFFERLRRAFEALEQAVDRGQLRAYGVTSWMGVRARRTDRDYLSLQEVVEVAQDIAGSRHHCKALQIPLNLAMPEAFLQPNQEVRGQLLTPLDAARQLGLVVFGSSPLHQGRLVQNRLPHVPPLPTMCQLPERDPAAVEALQFARSIPGIASTLVGMRRSEHVATAARLLHHPRAPLEWLCAAARPNPSASYVG